MMKNFDRYVIYAKLVSKKGILSNSFWIILLIDISFYEFSKYQKNKKIY